MNKSGTAQQVITHPQGGGAIKGLGESFAPTTSPNPFATQLFGDGSITISPVDRWTLELPIAENPWFTTVSPSDIAEFDGSELDDAVIELEYLVLEKS